MPEKKSYFTVEYTTKQLWGVVVEADNDIDASNKFDRGEWHGDPFRISDRDTIQEVEFVYETDESGGDL